MSFFRELVLLQYLRPIPFCSYSSLSFPLHYTTQASFTTTTMMASISKPEDDKPQAPPRRTFVCSCCDREIKIHSRVWEEIASLISNLRLVFRGGTTLIETTPSPTLDEKPSSAGAQPSPEAHHPFQLLDQRGEPITCTEFDHLQGQRQPLLSSEASHPSHHPHVLPQSDARSAWAELAGIQHDQAQGHSYLDQVFPGQYGSSSTHGSRDPCNDTNTKTGDESPSSPHERADVSDPLSDDDEGSESSLGSRAATDGSEPGRKLRRKDLRAISQVKVPPHPSDLIWTGSWLR